MRVEAQTARGGDARVLLSEASGGGIARIGEWGSAGVFVLAVQCGEVVPAHEHLAADFHEFGNIDFRAGQILRNGRNRPHVERDILAGHAIASRQSLFEHAVTVHEIQCQTVDLDFTGHRQRFGFRPVEIADHTVVPVTQLFDGKHVIEAHHARRVTYGGKIVGKGTAYAMGRRLRGVQGRELRFQCL